MPTLTSPPIASGDPEEWILQIQATKKKKVAKENGEEFCDIYTKVLKESPFIDGNDGALIPVDDIPWLNLSLVRIGMQWFQDYLGLYFCTSVIAMVSLGVSIKPISMLTFRTDKPIEPKELFRKFLGKLRGIEKFFNVLLDPTEARKVFYKTRKMHELAVRKIEKVGSGRPLPEFLVMKEEPWMRDYAEAVKKDVDKIPFANKTFENEVPSHVKEHLSWNASLPFTQFGLVYLPVGLFGVVWQRPQLFGMKSRDDIKMKGLIHVWAVVAKLLGLRDEFNIFINPDPENIECIIRDVYLHSLKNIDKIVIYLQSVVTAGIYEHIPFLTQGACLALTIQTLGCSKIENLWNVMNLKDKCIFKFLQGIFWLGGTFKLLRHIGNWLFKRVIRLLYIKLIAKPASTYKFQ